MSILCMCKVRCMFIDHKYYTFKVVKNNLLKIIFDERPDACWSFGQCSMAEINLISEITPSLDSRGEVRNYGTESSSF